MSRSSLRFSRLSFAAGFPFALQSFVRCSSVAPSSFFPAVGRPGGLGFSGAGRFAAAAAARQWFGWQGVPVLVLWRPGFVAVFVGVSSVPRGCQSWARAAVFPGCRGVSCSCCGSFALVRGFCSSCGWA